MSGYMLARGVGRHQGISLALLISGPLWENRAMTLTKIVLASAALLGMWAALVFWLALSLGFDIWVPVVGVIGTFAIGACVGGLTIWATRALEARSA